MAPLYQPPPAEQVYASHLPGKYIGFAVETYFAARFPYLSPVEWNQKIRSGQITVNGRPAPLGTVLREHDYIVTRMGLRQEPPADRRVRIVYENRAVRVFNKGAPLPVHPCGRYFKNSLTEILKERYPEEVPRPVQRLDALTTGLVVFAKTRPAAADLMEQFAANRVEKEYRVLVKGVPRRDRFSVDAPVGKIKGSARTAGPLAGNPKPARTDFELLEVRGGDSLLKAVPQTGRTNQIRVHLAYIGLPLWNDPVYGREESPGKGMGLHAHRLVLEGAPGPLRLEAPWPEHFDAFLEGGLAALNAEGETG